MSNCYCPLDPNIRGKGVWMGNHLIFFTGKIQLAIGQEANNGRGLRPDPLADKRGLKRQKREEFFPQWESKRGKVAYAGKRGTADEKLSAREGERKGGEGGRNREKKQRGTLLKVLL